MALERIYRRVDPGIPTEPRLVQPEGDRFLHYIDRRFDGPLQQGWRVESCWLNNWDGGPGLRRDVRVLDTPDPFNDAFDVAAEVMTRAEELACQLVECLRAWGAGEPRVFVWHLGRIEPVGDANDVLISRNVILQELAQLSTVPAEIDDPYGAFGPDGPPAIPSALVGRRIDELPNPEPILGAMRSLGISASLANDEIRLALAAAAT